MYRVLGNKNWVLITLIMWKLGSKNTTNKITVKTKILIFISQRDVVTNRNNYRPVSVLPAISKLFEKVMFDQLYASFTPTLSSNMLHFMEGHSCPMVLIKLTDDWRSALDKKERDGCGCH